MENIEFRELDSREYLTFFTSLNNARQTNSHGCFVSLETPEYWSRSTLFLCGDGVAGFAINNGNLEGVHKNPELASLIGDKKVMPQIMKVALNNGVEKLDCFGEGLTKQYMKYGFIPVGKMKFDIRYNPTWPVETFGEPDVIAMMKAVRNSDELRAIQEVSVDERYSNIIDRLTYFDDYNELLNYRDAKLEYAKENDLSYNEIFKNITSGIKK